MAHPEIINKANSRIGSRLNDKWQLTSLLGVGGMAAVYAATHRNKKRAAIKILHRELSVDPDIRARFLREGYAANSVGHPGVVGVDDDDVAEDGSTYLVMQLLEGETIDARWERKQRRLPLEEVMAISEQLLEILAVAHSHGIVHRDLKPENLFLTHEGIVKILDFGIARVRDPADPDAGASSTQTGTLMGTPAFMAPEQAKGRWKEVDQRTDLWAVGATMFTLLTGRFVHEAETANEVLSKAMIQPVMPIRNLFPELDSRIADVIDKSLAYPIQERWSDAKAMADAAKQAFVDSEGTPARAPLLTIPDTQSELHQLNPTLSAPTSTNAGVSADDIPGLTKRSMPRQALLLAAVAIVGVLGALSLRNALFPPPLPVPATQSPPPPVTERSIHLTPDTIPMSSASAAPQPAAKAGVPPAVRAQSKPARRAPPKVRPIERKAPTSTRRQPRAVATAPAPSPPATNTPIPQAKPATAPRDPFATRQ
ncbi:MAG: protein kinase [Polyangiaceae bacterium]|nr:protein kinase [Polyangiaceae bacterium]